MPDADKNLASTCAIGAIFVLNDNSTDAKELHAGACSGTAIQ